VALALVAAWTRVVLSSCSAFPGSARGTAIALTELAAKSQVLTYYM
jgi:hypothetical protein